MHEYAVNPLNKTTVVYCGLWMGWYQMESFGDNEMRAAVGFVSVIDGRVPLMSTEPLPHVVVESVIAKFGPRIHFHPREKFLPSRCVLLAGAVMVVCRRPSCGHVT